MNAPENMPTYVGIGKPDGTWTDITDMVTGVNMEPEPVERTPDEEQRWANILGGLQTGSMSLSFKGSETRSLFDTDLAIFKAQHRMRPPTRITVLTPDGRWQRIKHWLKRHRLAPKWLKVRYVSYSMDTYLERWPDGFGGRTVGPIEKGLEER